MLHPDHKLGLQREWHNEAARLKGALELTENAVQALCRDILVEALIALERAGIPVVLHVHDEIVAMMVDTDAVRLYPAFQSIMNAQPKWAKGFPISVGCWLNQRYVKE